MSSLDETAERAWLHGLPKTELHLHLEGAIPVPALWEIMQGHGGDPEVPTVDALRERFRFRDFPHFIETWMWKTTFLRTYDDFTLIGQAVAKELERQNIVYAEAFFTPLDHEPRGLEPQRLAAALRTGLSRAPGVEVRLIADLGRDFGPERGGRLVEALSTIPRDEVIGIGLGGSEQRYPAEPFAGVFERARALGFHTVAHAGEAAGAQSVRAAVEVLGAERIGHGTRAAEDPSVVDLLVRRRIPVECCPLSNLRTAVISSIRDHPIRAYFERGIPVTVNTDDPAMFGNTLVDDLYALRSQLGFSRSEIVRVLRNGIECSWAPQERKAGLAADLERAAA
jgi:adenosine deaminase